MDIVKFKKAEEIKANIKRLNGAIAEMDNMLSGDFSSFTYVVFHFGRYSSITHPKRQH